MNMNNPRVRTMNPQERKARMGRRMAFTRPKAIAITATAHQPEVPSIRMPGISQTAAATAMDVMTQRISSLMFFSFLY
jgi:hypothetical protein